MVKAKKLQLKATTKRLFTGTEVGTLLEDIDQKLGIISESQQMTDQKLDRFISGQNNLTQRVDRTEIRLDILETKHS